MKILASETATPIGSAALLNDEVVVAEAESPVPTRHLEWLVPAIQGMLEESGWQVADVEGVAVSRGPGSFTGLRIGMVTAAVWARSRGVPVVAISTLEAIAAGVDAPGTVCVVVDARRGEYAGAVFTRHGGEITRLGPDIIGSLNAILASLPPHGPVVFTGDALTEIWTSIAVHLSARAATAASDQWIPRARHVGRLGLRRLLSGDVDDPYVLLPAYTRSPVRE